MKTRVGLFFSGNTSKLDESFDLAFRLMSDLSSEKIELVPVYLSKDNRFYYDASFNKKDTFDNIDEFLLKLNPVSIVAENQRFSLMVNHNKYFSKKVETIDVGFNCVRTTDNFQVALQGYFELIGLPYTGCKVEGTVLGLDRVWCLQLLKENKVDIIDFIWDYSENIINEISEFTNRVKKLGLPCVMESVSDTITKKPIRIVHVKDIQPALEKVLGYSSKVVVEKEFSKCQEFSCAYLGNRNYEKTSAIAKYAEEKEMDTKTIDYSIDLDNIEMERRRWNVVDVSKRLTEELKYLTVKICRLLKLQGVVRITFYVSNDEKSIYVKEIDIFPSSLVLMMFEKQGISLNEIVKVLLQNAIVQ